MVERLRKVTGGAFGGRNFLSLGTGQVVMGLAQWGIISVLAILGGAGDVGLLAFALAVVTPVYELVKFKLRDVLATDIDGQWAVADYLRLTAIMSVLGFLVSVVIGWLLGGITEAAVVAGVAVSRGYESMSHISYGYQQKLDRMTPIGRSLFWRGLVSVALLAASYALTGSVVVAGVALAVANAAIYHLYDRRFLPADSLGDRLSRHGRGVRSLARSSFPLGIYSSLHALTDSVPRLVVGLRLGLAPLGIFAAFGYVVSGSSYVIRALSQAASSRMASVVASGQRSRLIERVGRLIAISFGAGAALMVGAYVLGEPFLRFAFGDEFAAFSFEFFLISIYALLLFVQSPLNLVLISARKFNAQLWIEASTTITATIGAFALVPGLEVRGAVYALILAGSVRLVLSAVLVGKLISRLE